MSLGGVPIAGSDLADAFASHFDNKVRTNVALARVDPNGVYNGRCQLLVQDRLFMDKGDVKECLEMLKNKKCEGLDREPVCLIKDARVPLLIPSVNFSKTFMPLGSSSINISHCAYLGGHICPKGQQNWFGYRFYSIVILLLGNYQSNGKY